jgi:hypothetical protein
MGIRGALTFLPDGALHFGGINTWETNVRVRETYLGLGLSGGGAITPNDDGGAVKAQTSFAFVARDEIDTTDDWVQYNTLRYDADFPRYWSQPKGLPSVIRAPRNAGHFNWLAAVF